MERYYIYEFSIHSAILIDTERKEWIIFSTNIWGQIYNLDEEPTKITGHKINGIIKRFNNMRRNRGMDYVTDQFIFNHIMTDEQRGRCEDHVEIRDKLIVKGDHLNPMIKELCHYMLKHRNQKLDYDAWDYYQSKVDKLFPLSV